MAYRGLGYIIAGPSGMPVETGSVYSEADQIAALADVANNPGSGQGTLPAGSITDVQLPFSTGYVPPSQAPSFLSQYSTPIILVSVGLLALMILGPGIRR